MLTRLADRFSYANVTATVALFVALGGTGYAAITLPRNSVGAKQIRKDAVRTAEIKDRSVHLVDLTTATRNSLRGQAGPAGAQGPAGPAGPAAVRYFAIVGASGQLQRGNATSGGSTTTGKYTIGFAQSVASCAYAATLISAGTPGQIVAYDGPNGGVAVETYNAAGVLTSLPFSLVVAC